MDLMLKNEECSHPDVFENAEEIEINYNYQCSRIYQELAKVI
jgi:predicted neuraminidase